jgi:dephospho-CoA kinase
MTIFTVAIGGGIAAGKTTATEYFSNIGTPILDADIVATDLTTTNTAVITAITTYFGQDILGSNNYLDRAKLRNIIFHDKAAKLWLEKLLHPKIQATIIAKRSLLNSSFCIIALPIIHANSRKIYGIDMICSLISNEDLRISRLVKRDLITTTAAKAIIANQISDTELAALSDTIITNNDDLTALYDNLKQLHKLILQQTL